MHGRFLLSVFSLCVTVLPVSPTLCQELPLTVEDILTARDRVRLDLNLEYFNTTRESLALGISENSDSLNLVAGIQYGLTLDTEVSIDASYRYLDRRTQLVDARTSDSEKQFDAISLGFSHRISADDETPGLILSGAVTHRRNSAWDDDRYGGVIGFTGYRSLDPVLLAVSVAYRDDQAHNLQDVEIDGGKSVSLSPSVSFAVNNRITFIGGVDWRWREGRSVSGDRMEINTTTTGIKLGVGYHWSQDLSLSSTTRFAVSEHGGSGVQMGLIYKFDVLR